MEDNTFTVALYYNNYNYFLTVPKEKRVLDTNKYILDPIKRSFINASLFIKELNLKNKRLKLKIWIFKFYRCLVYLFKNYKDNI